MSFVSLTRNFVITLAFVIGVAAPSQALATVAQGASYMEFGAYYLFVAATELTPVPEPASLALVGSGALVLAARMRKRRRQ